MGGCGGGICRSDLRFARPVARLCFRGRAGFQDEDDPVAAARPQHTGVRVLTGNRGRAAHEA